MADSRWSGRRLHFIGIGGAGMSGLAIVARALGAEVSGSDLADTPYCARLRDAGVKPAIGHDPAHVPPGAEVVVSTAIAEANEELAAARRTAAAVLHRGDLLAEVAAMKRSLAVAGAHGKTTTAAMAAHVLRETGRDPAYLIGGEIRPAGGNAAWGEGEWIVVEADESDRSFLKLAPEVAVVTNVELDHHATYRSPLELGRAFEEFAAKARARVRWEALTLPGEAVTFGIGAGDFAAEEVELLPLGARFKVAGAAVELGVPGRHNVLNAVAAIAACAAADVDPGEAGPALGSFGGIGRRFEPHGQTPSGALVFDDYAHHPTEVDATLEAARPLAEHRVVACFQPHLYSRTRHLAREFGCALAAADVVAVLDVYPARERAEDHPGVSGWLVARAAADAAGGRPVYWVPGMEDAQRLLSEQLGEGDVLITLGAGDVDRLARSLGSDGAEGRRESGP